jgi:hypothetical protein
MSWESLSATDQEGARRIFEEKIRDQLESILEEYEIVKAVQLNEEHKKTFLEEEVNRVTEACILDKYMEDFDWNEIEDWRDSWFRELIAEHGTAYDIYGDE